MCLSAQLSAQILALLTSKIPVALLLKRKSLHKSRQFAAKATPGHLSTKYFYVN